MDDLAPLIFINLPFAIFLLLTMAINGDCFFDGLFRLHSKELLAFAKRKTSGIGAEDLVQEAYLRLLQHPDPASIETPRAYLFKTTANLSTNQYRYDQVRVKHHSEEPVEPETLASLSPGPEKLADNSLCLDQLLAVLEELPELCQHAFILNKLDGMTYAEVAQGLGISTRTAERYILKAWQHCLKRLGENPFDGGLST